MPMKRRKYQGLPTKGTHLYARKRLAEKIKRVRGMRSRAGVSGPAKNVGLRRGIGSAKSAKRLMRNLY